MDMMIILLTQNQLPILRCSLFLSRVSCSYIASSSPDRLVGILKAWTSSNKKGLYAFASNESLDIMWIARPKKFFQIPIPQFFFSDFVPDFCPEKNSSFYLNHGVYFERRGWTRIWKQLLSSRDLFFHHPTGRSVNSWKLTSLKNPQKGHGRKKTWWIFSTHPFRNYLSASRRGKN